MKQLTWAVAVVFVGCGANTAVVGDTVQVGRQQLTVSGSVAHRQGDARSFEAIEAEALARGDLHATSSRAVFSPLAGVYEQTGATAQLTSCGFDTSVGTLLVKRLVVLDATHFAWDLYDPTLPEDPPTRVECELGGFANRVYRCNNEDFDVDFQPFGLDAVVSVDVFDDGVWLTNHSLVGYGGTRFKCVGADCGVSPASDFFGYLQGTVPCVDQALDYEVRTAP